MNLPLPVVAARRDFLDSYEALVEDFLVVTGERLAADVTVEQYGSTFYNESIKTIHLLREDRPMTDFGVAVKDLLRKKPFYTDLPYGLLVQMTNNVMLAIEPDHVREPIALANGLNYVSTGISIYNGNIRGFMYHVEEAPTPLNDAVLEMMSASGNGRLNFTGQGLLGGHGDLGPLFSREMWSRCIQAQNDVNFVNVHVATWQWEEIHSIPFESLAAACIPASFLQLTKASKVQMVYFSKDNAAAIGNRTLGDPIPFLRITQGGRAMIYSGWRDDFLRALERIQKFSCDARIYPWLLHCQYFWNRLRLNNSLLSLSIKKRLDDSLETHLLVLGFIRECLQTNWFLETIDIGIRFSPTLQAHWNQHIQPMLDTNKSHVPRVDGRERRLNVLLEALLRIQNHPAKTYLFLLEFNEVLIPIQSMATCL